MHHYRDVVDRQLHLLVVALVSLGNEFVDLAIRDLSQNAIAFADGQQDRVQHGVHAAHDFRVRTLELLRLATVGKLSLFGGVGQASHFFLQRLHDRRHVVDRLLHLLVVALVGLGNQFVDLAVGNLRQNAVAFADGQQDRVQHFIDALHDFLVNALKLLHFAALRQTALPRGVDQTEDFPRNQLHLGVSCERTAISLGSARLSALLYSFRCHNFQLL